MTNFRYLFKSKSKVIHEIIEREIENSIEDLDCDIIILNNRIAINGEKIVPFLAENYHTKLFSINGEIVERVFTGCNRVTISIQSIIKLCENLKIDIEDYTEALMVCLLDNIKCNRDPYSIQCIPLAM